MTQVDVNYRKDLDCLYSDIKKISQRYELYTEYIFEDLYNKHLRDY